MVALEQMKNSYKEKVFIMNQQRPVIKGHISKLFLANLSFSKKCKRVHVK